MFERLRLPACLALALAVAAPATAAPADATSPPVPDRGERVADAVGDRMATVRDAVLPYVVSILVVREDFAQGVGNLSLSGGSGTVISADGHVLTNAHVTDKGRGFRVIFGDGRELPARLVGSDPLSDLAVLKISAPQGTRFDGARFADTLTLQAGDAVVAIGAPWGMKNSLSAGVVNNPNRLLVSIFEDEADKEDTIGPDQPTGRYYAWIQHDASISPGNSGGPLVDMDGRIVGVNTRGSFFGGDMAFAIPGPDANRIARELIERGSVTRAEFGMRLRSLSGSGLGDGVLINSVRPDGPAGVAGLKPGDRIVAIDGERVDAPTADAVPALERQLVETAIGRALTLTVLRIDGTRREVRLIAERASPDRGDEREIRAWGLSLVELTPAMAERRGLPYREGLLITGIRPGGAASTASPALAKGDVIRMRDGRALTRLDAIVDCDADAATSAANATLLEVDRAGAALLSALSPRPCVEVKTPQTELPKPWAGVMVQPVDPKLARLLGAGAEVGYRITRVVAGTPFADAGGKVGDVVIAIDGAPVPVVNATDTTPFEQRVRNADPGKALAVTVLRDGARRELALALETAPAPDTAMAQASIEEFGIRVRELSFFDRIERRLGDEIKGVLLESVESGGLGGLAHLERNDIVLSIDGVETTNVGALRAALERARDATTPSIVFTVRRDRETRLLFLERDWLKDNN